ncbi:helix-turn-helix domain-containing protein [Planococcus chinensis]|uniref:Helix-turn-helix domain-containing protein n=1 Tax=Planococcus chinensis TaxID=272917 RepID=A0ABW4QGB2_9BACL
MLFDEFLISIMKAVNLERTLSSPYHLIKGKKSGQTIQDIGYYQLYPYFAVMPKLEKAMYDDVVKSLFTRNLLRPNDEVIDLADAAFELEIPPVSVNGWKYRGNEAVFLRRLSLIVQTLSYTSQQEFNFDPVHNAEDVQGWVKRYLKAIRFREMDTVRSFKAEIEVSLERTRIPDSQKLMLMQRMSGKGLSGLTWSQIAAGQGIHPLDAQLAVIEALHTWLDVLESKEFPLLLPLLEGVIEQSALTDSTRRTEKLFEQGLSLEEIAAVRNLKKSTIEDHFVELAMNDPFFNYTAFVPENLYRQIMEISSERKTKRLREIKDRLPDATYFQIRLALAVKEVPK